MFTLGSSSFAALIHKSGVWQLSGPTRKNLCSIFNIDPFPTLAPDIVFYLRTDNEMVSFVSFLPQLCVTLCSLPGKGTGGLNLGNFFASRKGYSRKGFDRLSTEGSDQEKDEDDGSESEEEYSAPVPAAASSS